jgi:hypothetical protein
MGYPSGTLSFGFLNPVPIVRKAAGSSRRFEVSIVNWKERGKKAKRAN